MEQELASAGFEAEFSDITATSPRPAASTARAAASHPPPRAAAGPAAARRQLENYAGIEGSTNSAFAERRRAYLMTAASKG